MYILEVNIYETRQILKATGEIRDDISEESCQLKVILFHGTWTCFRKIRKETKVSIIIILSFSPSLTLGRYKGFCLFVCLHCFVFDF